MRKVKQLLLVALTMMLVLISASNVKAAVELVIINKPLSPTQMIEGLELYQGTALSYHNGGDREDRQIFQAVVKPASSETVQIVSWAKGTDDAWGRATLTETAADFERRNPGYIVLAGVNGDFFDINNTFQPCNNFISMGDVWKKDCIKPTIDPATHQISFNSGYGLLGFKEDGSYLLGPAYAADDMSLKLLDGRIVSDEFTVNTINEIPSGDGIGLYYPNSGTEIPVTGYTVYKGEYDFYRLSNGGGYVGDATGQPRGSFVKGNIVEISNTLTTIPSIPLGTFYLVSKSATLAEALLVGQTVKCEYSMVGNFADVTNSMGFSLQCLKNSQPIQVAGTDTNYHVNSNPRSLIGFKEDGSVVLMTIDGRQGTIGAVGVSTYEAGEFLRQFGCINGFNLDGGGSVTSIARNAQGKFDVLNHPSDGGERSLGNALLFVMRDPKIRVTKVDTRSITVEQLGAVASGNIQNARVQISGGGLGSALPYETLTDKVVFSNLERDTNYTITYNYEILDEFGKTLSSENTEVEVTTLGTGVPEIADFQINRSDGNSITFDYEVKTYDDVTNIVKRYITYGVYKFDLTEDEDRVTLTDLPAGESLEFKLVVEYELNEQTSQVESEVLKYDVPALPQEEKKGCLSGSVINVFGLATLASAALLVLRRKH